MSQLEWPFWLIRFCGKMLDELCIFQFDLVCDDAYKADLATTIYFCGVTLGGIFFGILADKFGRKPIIAVTLLATGITGMAIFIFRTYIAFVVLRFFLGFFIQVAYINVLCDTAGPKSPALFL